MVKQLSLPQKDGRVLLHQSGRDRDDDKRRQEVQLYFEKKRASFRYDLSLPNQSLNGNIAYLLKGDIFQIIETLWPGLPLGSQTLNKLLVRIPVYAVKAIFKAIFKGYPFSDFKDYAFVSYSDIDLPDFYEKFSSDTYFGLQRVLGPNPCWLEELSAVGENDLRPHIGKLDSFKEYIKNNNVVRELAGKPYDDALAEKRLYIADYSILKDDIVDYLKQLEVNGSYAKKYVKLFAPKDANRIEREKTIQQHATNPFALFYRQDNGYLQPLAILLRATEAISPENPVYTPADGQFWTMAKVFAQTADAIAQLGWTHVARTHYFMGAVTLATYRNFYESHPLLALLRQHCEGTLFVNTSFPFFRYYITDPKIWPFKDAPPFGMALPGDNKEALPNFIGKGMRNFDFARMSFINDLRNRGVEDPELYYPYRDDGKLIWDAIHDFVAKYVGLYYKSDDDVVGDTELQAWAQELGGNIEAGKMGIPGFPTQLATVADVVETVGNVIFIATAQHSSVHYALHTYLGYAPNMMYSLMNSPEAFREKGSFTKEDWIGLAPPLTNVLVQALGYYLNDLRVNQIGQYDLEQFEDSAVSFVREYQQKLQEISSTVKARNQEREYPYSLLDPENVTNSITG